MYPRLLKHIELNNAGWVRANPSGLLDHQAAAHEFFLPDQRGWASAISQGGEGTRSVQVPITTLDRYVEEHGISPNTISFIKVDVEGAELEVLRGAEATLRATSAAVLAEHVPPRAKATGHAVDGVRDFMHGLGFAPYTDPLLGPIRPETGHRTGRGLRRPVSAARPSALRAQPESGSPEPQ